MRQLVFISVADWKRAFMRSVLGKDPATLEYTEPDAEEFEHEVRRIPKHGVVWERALNAALELAESGIRSYRQCVNLVKHFLEPLAPLTFRERRALRVLVLEDELPQQPRCRAELLLFLMKEGERLPWKDFVFSPQCSQLRRANPLAMAEIALLHGGVHAARMMLREAVMRGLVAKAKLEERYTVWARLPLGEKRLPFLCDLLELSRNKRNPILVH